MLKNLKNLNLNNFIIEGKIGGENALGITQYIMYSRSNQQDIYLSFNIGEGSCTRVCVSLYIIYNTYAIMTADVCILHVGCKYLTIGSR